MSNCKIIASFEPLKCPRCDSPEVNPETDKLFIRGYKVDNWSQCLVCSGYYDDKHDPEAGWFHDYHGCDIDGYTISHEAVAELRTAKTANVADTIFRQHAPTVPMKTRLDIWRKCNELLKHLSRSWIVCP